MRRLISAIWHTLKEPRVITLIMVLVYVLILANGIFVLLHHTSWFALMYALFSVVGCALAIPSAWRGCAGWKAQLWFCRVSGFWETY